MSKQLIEMAADWLKANGYDGLHYDGECGCPVDGLMPCDQPNQNCEAGYKWTRNQCQDAGLGWAIDPDFCDPGGGWMMRAEKPEEPKND